MTRIEPNIYQDANGSFRVYRREPDARTGKSKKIARRFPRGTSMETLRGFRDMGGRGMAISVRVDRRVAAAFRQEAVRQGIGYDVLLHNVFTGLAIMFGGPQ